MNKDVKVQLEIFSTIDNGEFGSEDNRLTAWGILRRTEKGYSISYKEVGEGGSVDCTIQTNGTDITVTREGVSSSTMRFKEGTTHHSVYSVGGFCFDMEIRTESLYSSVSYLGGEISLSYSMIIGGAPKRCRMKITAKV
jgi:uncharacterized beta-barrel protein YwiB (DUF1934 family)